MFAQIPSYFGGWGVLLNLKAKPLRSNSLPVLRFPCSNVLGWRKVVCLHGQIALLPLRCRDCTSCYAYKGFQRARRIQSHLKDIGYDKFAFLTLTTKGNPTWEQVMRKWNSMRYFLRSKGYMAEYVMVKEEGTTSGMKHLHIIYRWLKYIPNDEISRRWSFRNMGSITFIKKVAETEHGRELGRYLSDYVSKAVNIMGVRKAFTASNDWPKLVEENSTIYPSDAKIDLDKGYKIVAGGVVLYNNDGVRLGDCECFGKHLHIPWVGSDGDRDHWENSRKLEELIESVLENDQLTLKLGVNLH